MMEKHLIEVENLKWQIEYERKLQQEMNSLLENKVSGLMADKEELEKQISKLFSNIDSLNSDKDGLNQVIQ